MLKYFLNEKGIDYLVRNFDNRNYLFGFLKQIYEDMRRKGAFIPSDSGLLGWDENAKPNKTWRKIQDMGLVTIENIPGAGGEAEVSPFSHVPPTWDGVFISVNGKEIPMDEYLKKIYEKEGDSNA